MSQKQAVKYDNQLSCSRLTSLFPISIYFFLLRCPSELQQQLMADHASGTCQQIPLNMIILLLLLSPFHTQSSFLFVRFCCLLLSRFALSSILFGSPAASTLNAHSYPANTSTRIRTAHTYTYTFSELCQVYLTFILFLADGGLKQNI